MNGHGPNELRPIEYKSKIGRNAYEKVNTYGYKHGHAAVESRDRSYGMRNSPQYPKRMWRPKLAKTPTQADIESGRYQITEKDFDRLIFGKEAVEEHDRKMAEATQGLRLDYRHRYGDDYDILRRKFTKTPEELETEKFRLIVACRQLLATIFWALKEIPKEEKFVLGQEIRVTAYNALKLSIMIKKRFYRKNMLESMDIDMEILREIFSLANRNYPKWVTDKVFHEVMDAINQVGYLIGGLLKSTVV